ncbi:MAG: flavin reductase family protein [Candidatus Eremiobacteraeota bacterium]|nr:flavin reductase family protein [Candidatus Eremiobacteraeota bacterium]
MAGAARGALRPSGYRAVMRRFPTGVTIVTTVLHGAPKGFTANAVASVSAEPPMVLVCVSRQARTHPIIAQSGRFCVNLLRLDQEALARRFASREHPNPFTDVRYGVDATGSPVIEGVLAYLDCEVAEEYSAGTHTILIGSVVSCASAEGAPLGYFDGRYRDFGVNVS